MGSMGNMGIVCIVWVIPGNMGIVWVGKMVIVGVIWVYSI